MTHHPAIVAVLGMAALASLDAQTPLPVPTPLQVLAGIPSIQGRVSDPEGQPIAGATVAYVFLAKNLRGSVVTNAAGEFRLRFSLQSDTSGWFLAYTGPHRFDVSARGYRPASTVVTLEAGKTARLDVTLEPIPVREPVRLTQAEYAARAVEAVRATLRLRQVSLDNVRIELLAEADIIPDHAALHRDGTVPLVTSNLPDALVRVAIWRGRRFDQTATVVFVGTNAHIELSYNGSSGFLPLEEAEWRRVAAALEPFYAAAVEAGLGWQRFLPFLPANMRTVLRRDRPKQRLGLPLDAADYLSQDDLRQFVALQFDRAVLLRWAEFEGLSEQFQTELDAAGRDQDMRVFIPRLDQALGRFRSRLQDLGVFDEEHFARSAGFLRRVIGEGLVTREAPQRDRITGLPGGARMYSPPLGGWSAAIFPHLILTNGRPLLVALDLP
jgi:hypothetical protein